jgi:hypothetical protein
MNIKIVLHTYKMADIVYYYTNELKRFLQTTNIFLDVRITHSNTNLCFNCMQREILYAIESCFKEKGYKNIMFRENILGKALLVPIKSLSIDVSLNHFMNYYKYHFMKRMVLIEQYFKSKNMDYQDCLKEKKELLNTYETVFSIEQLPRDICMMIKSYLVVDIRNFLRVRKLYEEKRKVVDK